MTEEEKRHAQNRVRQVVIGGEIPYRDLVVAARFTEPPAQPAATCQPWQDGVRRTFVPKDGFGGMWVRVE